MRTFKGGPGSGRRPSAQGPVVKPSTGGGSFGHGRSDKPSHYSEQPASRNPGKPRAGARPGDLYPYGRNPNGTPRTPNDPVHAPKDPKKP